MNCKWTTTELSKKQQQVIFITTRSNSWRDQWQRTVEQCTTTQYNKTLQTCHCSKQVIYFHVQPWTTIRHATHCISWFLYADIGIVFCAHFSCCVRWVSVPVVFSLFSLKFQKRQGCIRWVLDWILMVNECIDYNFSICCFRDHLDFSFIYYGFCFNLVSCSLVVIHASLVAVSLIVFVLKCGWMVIEKAKNKYQG